MPTENKSLKTSWDTVHMKPASAESIKDSATCFVPFAFDFALFITNYGNSDIRYIGLKVWITNCDFEMAIPHLIFFLRARAGGTLESCNLIGSESGQDFPILPTVKISNDFAARPALPKRKHFNFSNVWRSMRRSYYRIFHIILLSYRCQVKGELHSGIKELEFLQKGEC